MPNRRCRFRRRARSRATQVTDSRGASATKSYRFTVSGAPLSGPVTVVEFYDQGLDHYFITRVPDEIAKLDAGTTIKGWVRTAETFKAHLTPQAGPPRATGRISS